MQGAELKSADPSKPLVTRGEIFMRLCLRVACGTRATAFLVSATQCELHGHIGKCELPSQGPKRCACS